MIDIDNKYQTRDGRPVRLISNNGSSTFPVIGFISACSTPDCWRTDGMYSEHGMSSPMDLVPVPPPPPKKVKVAVWLDSDGDARCVRCDIRGDKPGVQNATRYPEVIVELEVPR
jgi:hypothetical protein